MTIINLETFIEAPIQAVFDLSRNIDFHQKSASQTDEKAIGGVTKGHIGFGESVSWRGKHFGCYLTHTSKIVEFERPKRFTDVMTKGNFTYFAHQHVFEVSGNGCRMTDILTYKIPYGFLGRWFDHFMLNKHLTKFLEHRNFQLKTMLENK